MSPSDFNQIGGKETTVARYSEERKEAVLSKLLPPYNLTVAELARQEGISEPTLYTWRNKARSERRPVPGRKATSEQWSAEAKLATVIETAALSEAELSQYCREKRLYPDQVKQWKAESLQGECASAQELGRTCRHPASHGSVDTPLTMARTARGGHARQRLSTRSRGCR